ncbi:unnamed protein product [Orchesella dallaii]|uniref:Kazal-like domain-containing protein n=1 Tax=Orchesella dallaii TaxID=48710 RepID=A0ABP1R3I7_9HEXA
MVSYSLVITLALGLAATTFSATLENKNYKKSLVSAQTETGSLSKSAESNFDMHSVNASITYWDIDDDKLTTAAEKQEWKLEILTELMTKLDHCICPKLLGPFVCDNNRRLHSNLCYFKCVQGKSDPAITPMMILAIQSYANSKNTCTNRI